MQGINNDKKGKCNNMRYLDTIFKGLCVLILVLSTYIKRERLAEAFRFSPIASRFILVAGILGMIIIIGLLTISVIRV